MEVSLTETETRYFSDLFVCCDVEKTGKIPMLKSTELFRSANISNEVLNEITSLAGIPSTALHISRSQFYSCLKLIAAHQASMLLRQELIAATVQLPLPRFSWKESPSVLDGSGTSSLHTQTNGGINAIPPPPTTDRKNSLTRRQEWQEVRPTSSRRNSTTTLQPQPQQQQQQQQEAAVNSDVQSTDSEVEQNESSGVADSSGREMHRRRAGSPEAWSTNSDSPTPTNSVAERPWAKENLWHGLLGDEHRQLLGTEEESSDRHSSDDDDNETDLETVYQITPEQRDYYYKQFKAVQHDPNGLLSGQVARVFFEKSRIPVEELRHIWQLCDVTRDGALSLSEFTAAMHLVVLRRNNIPLPTTLPACLHPSVLQHSSTALAAPTQPPPQPQEPAEADLLHLNDDDEEENTENTIISAVNATTNPIVQNNEKNIMNASTLSTSSQTSIKSRQIVVGNAGNHPTGLTPPPPPLPTAVNPSIPNSPHEEPTTSPSNVNPTRAVFKNKDHSLWTTDVPPTQWTKFTESPTSNVSSPGPKPVNFDMQRTAQAVVSDPQILHPVPLRVTPVSGAISNAGTASNNSVVEPLNKEVFDGATLNTRNNSPSKQLAQSGGATTNAATVYHRDSLQQQTNDLRAIQRPQAKKLPAKNVGGIPPPPQREPSVGSSSSGGIIVGAGGDAEIVNNNNNTQPTQLTGTKKDVQPPLPPPRPHRHGRSSSLDLNKFKMNTTGSDQQPEITAQASFDLQTSTGFADFTQFPDDGAKEVSAPNAEQQQQQQQHSLPPQQTPSSANSTTTAVLQNAAALPLSRISLQSNQRVSAFEVYRKPNTPRNSQSPPSHSQMQQYAAASGQPVHPPPPAPFGAAGAAAIAGTVSLPPPTVDHYEKRVNAITETLRHVSFKPDSNMTDILRHLREQNSLLLHLCNDLSDELLSVQTRKEELRLKLEANDINAASCSNNNALAASLPVPRTGSSISAPVTANTTGGSGSSGVHSNV